MRAGASPTSLSTLPGLAVSPRSGRCVVRLSRRGVEHRAPTRLSLCNLGDRGAGSSRRRGTLLRASAVSSLASMGGCACACESCVPFHPVSAPCVDVWRGGRRARVVPCVDTTDAPITEACLGGHDGHAQLVQALRPRHQARPTTWRSAAVGRPPPTSPFRQRRLRRLHPLSAPRPRAQRRAWSTADIFRARRRMVQDPAAGESAGV